MLKSMTAYGRGEYAQGDTAYIAEIKSVNHRYRDMHVRMPKAVQILEDEVRSLVASRVSRGRIEVSLQLEKTSGEPNYAMDLNLPMARAYVQVLQKIGEEFGLEHDIRPDFLSQMKDVIVVKPEEVDVDGLRTSIEVVIGKALDSLDEMRAREGSMIEEDFRGRIEKIEQHLEYIKDKAPLVVEDFEKRLKNKIAKIAREIDLDEGRIIQEVAIFADRCDITEEITRTKSHLQQFSGYLSEGKSIGRRLDFLMQEIHREANTMSSKANDASISTKVVEVKAELEKLREQIQNVE
ncbi:YicC/YloC family endoribonuclease [Thermodesulfobacteriota bacterium]